MAARAHNLALALAAKSAAIHGAEQPFTDLESCRRSAAAADQSALCLSGVGFIGSRLAMLVAQEGSVAAAKQALCAGAPATASLRDSADYLTSQTSNGELISPMTGSALCQKA
jgi:hypothetical protein